MIHARQGLLYFCFHGFAVWCLFRSFLMSFSIDEDYGCYMFILQCFISLYDRMSDPYYVTIHHGHNNGDIMLFDLNKRYGWRKNLYHMMMMI
jgi:hypothetical protein